MLSLTQNIVIAVLMMALALCFMVLVNGLWPASERYAKEDLIGWQLNILATTHAVILGFMLYTEWTNFSAVKLNAEFEANALRNVFRLAEGLPQPARSQLEDQARAYANAVVTDDWPLLARGQTPELSHLINRSMWKTLMSVKQGSAGEITALDHALSELSTMTQCRRTRLLQAASRLPGIFWCVLLVGGHSYRRLGGHVRLAQPASARLPGLFSDAADYARHAGDRRSRPAVPGFGTHQQLPIRAGARKHERGAVSGWCDCRLACRRARGAGGLTAGTGMRAQADRPRSMSRRHAAAPAPTKSISP